MISLFLSVCLIANPDSCKELQFPLEYEPTPQQCIFEGQKVMSMWEEDHPGYRLVKYSCGTPKQKI